jgi:UDP-2-acetamido-3-amino-2,3-dideoxy-glucuronate N-acetyltransferase
MTQSSDEAGPRLTAQPDTSDMPSMGSYMADLEARYTDASTRVLVHPQALCEAEYFGNHVGAGTRIWAFAHILGNVGEDCSISNWVAMEPGATIGNRVKVKPFVVLCDGLTVEDDVFIGPGVMFTNDLRARATIKRTGDELLPTLVQTGATLSAGVVVIPGMTIGAHAFIGACAVVVRDVPAHGLVVGNPGRLVGWVCECASKLADDLICSCGRAYQKDSTGLIRIG